MLIMHGNVHQHIQQHVGNQHPITKNNKQQQILMQYITCLNMTPNNNSTKTMMTPSLTTIEYCSGCSQNHHNTKGQDGNHLSGQLEVLYAALDNVYDIFHAVLRHQTSCVVGHISELHRVHLSQWAGRCQTIGRYYCLVCAFHADNTRRKTLISTQHLSESLTTTDKVGNTIDTMTIERAFCRFKFFYAIGSLFASKHKSGCTREKNIAYSKGSK